MWAQNSGIHVPPQPPALRPPGERGSELNTRFVLSRILPLKYPSPGGTPLRQHGEQPAGRFQIGTCTVVRKRMQFFVFFHFPPRSSSVWLSSAAQVPWIIWKLLPYVGTGKNVLIGRLRKELGAASPSCQRMSLRLERATGCLSCGRSRGASPSSPIQR